MITLRTQHSNQPVNRFMLGREFSSERVAGLPREDFVQHLEVQPIFGPFVF